MIHQLKTWPEYFERIVSGAKTFEYRRNDRKFEEGDMVSLLEWDPEIGIYTGRQRDFKIGYILPMPDNLFCVFSLLPATAEDSDVVKAAIDQANSYPDPKPASKYLLDMVSDEAVDKAFENTRFGSTPRREFIRDALLKVASGYHNGHTIECIVKELGLVTTRLKLTKKGEKYLYWSIDPLINPK